MEILQVGSKGPSVELLQSILKKLGFYYGDISGDFSKFTQISVKNFQSQFRFRSRWNCRV